MSSVRGSNRRVELHTASTNRPTPPRTPGEAEAQMLLRRFPPRPAVATWPGTRHPRDRILDRLLAPPFAPSSPGRMAYRRRALSGILEWLSGQPGDTWQQRWLASGADAAGNVTWRDLAVSWLRSEGSGYPDAYYWELGGRGAPDDLR